MQVPKYESQVNINPEPTVRVQSVADQNAFGANVAQGEANEANGLLNVSKQIQQQVNEQQLTLNKEKVISSYNNYMDEASKIKNDLMNKQGLDAKGISSQANSMFTELNKKYMSGLDNKPQQLAFTGLIDNAFRSAQDSILRHETQQIEIGTEKSGQATIDNSINRVAGNPLNADAINLERNNTYAVIDGLFLKKYGKEFTDEMKRNYNDKLISGGVTTLLNQDNPDYENASKFLDANKKSISADMYDRLRPAIHAGQAKSETYQFKQNIKNDPSYHIDGDLSKPLDSVKVNQWIEQNYGPGATRTINVSGNGLNWDSIKSAAEPFVGMSYKMGGNGGSGIDCSSFVQQVYGQNGVELPRTADYQYKYYNDKGQIFTDKSQLKPGDIVFIKNTYDPVAAGQEPCVDNNGVTHVGIYAGDGKVLQAGNSGVGTVDMSVFSEYAGYAHPTTGQQSQKTISGYDPEKYKALTQAAQQVVQESNIQYNQQQASLHDQIAEHCRLNPNESIDARQTYINSLGLTGTRYSAALSLGLQQYGIQKSIDKAEEAEAGKQAENDILNGKFSSGKSFEMEYAGKLPLATLKSFSNYIDAQVKKGVDNSFQEPPEMQIKAGQDAFKLGLARANFNKDAAKEDGIDLQNAETMIRDKVTQRIKAARDEGKNVTTADITEWTVEEATQQRILNKGWISDDKIKSYKIPYGFEQRPDGVYDQNGRKLNYDPKTGDWTLADY